MEWKTEVLPVITPGCLNCIRTVELNKPVNPAVLGDCIIHDWPKALPSERETCGEYSISEFYYERCTSRTGPRIRNVTATDWKECAFDDQCARNCVFNYVISDRDVDCGRGALEDRLCVDYGITHAFGEDACSLRPQAPDIIQYAKWMVDQCGVADPPPPKPNQPTTLSTTTTASVTAIVVPVVVSTVIIVAMIVAVLWYVQRKRRQHESMSEIGLGVRNENSYNYGPDGSYEQAKFKSAFNLDQCSEEIKNMVKQHLLPLDYIEVMEEIGRGQFGVIRKAKYFTNADLSEYKLVAIKTIRNPNREKYEEEVQSFLREAYTMSQFDHINVINLIGLIWENDESPAVVCPYMGKGSLLDLVKRSEMKFSETDRMSFVVQIAAGLEYLERMKFVHRDIALRNCLVSELYVIKISDFGLTRDIYDSRVYECSDVTEKQLPWKWLAPECIKQGTFTHKSDVWSFGVTIWELFTNGSSPYPAIGNLSVLQECLETGYRLSKPDNLSQQLYDLMRLMWSANPEHRPHFSELLQSVKLLESKQSPPAEYSYTIGLGEPSSPDTASGEYMTPTVREGVRDSVQYADSPITNISEPDIY